MKQKNKLVLNISIVIYLVGVAFSSHVSAALVCTFQDPSMSTLINFGVYIPGQGTPTLGTGTIKFRCHDDAGILPVGTVNYSIAIDQGLSGSFVTRQMKLGANSINYNLYTDVTYTTVLGDGTISSGTSELSGLCLLNTDCEPVIYGRIDAGQIAVGGNYQDIVTVTLTF